VFNSAGKFRFVLISFLLLFSSLASRAQVWPFELWHEGKMVLTSGDTLRGLLKYDLQQDLVQYTFNNKEAEVFTARKILFFEIFDTSVNHYRRFYALPYASSPGYETPIFFELLEEGKMTLLAREFLEYRSTGSMYVRGILVLSHKYFLMQENGKISDFSGKKNDLLNMMGKEGDKVDKFMKTNRLRFEYKEDFARIIDYYNSLFGI
jgi:hypothetical protein